MRALVLLLFSFVFSFALNCNFQTVNGRQACVCTDRGNSFIVDDSYCSSSCSCPSISQVLQDFVNTAKNTDLFRFLSSFQLNVSSTPPPPVPVDLPPFLHTSIDIAGHPLMLTLLSVLKTAWIIFATILSYFIIFRR